MNPWHALPIHAESPGVVLGIIEIAKGQRAKYEIDKETGYLKLDRVLLPSMSYPANYGFIPRTYADDKDPLDVLVLSQVKLQPGCIVDARVIGVLRMMDGGEHDDKIIAVAKYDASVKEMQDIHDVPSYLRDEIAHFFSEYKTLEGKSVDLKGFEDREAAIQIIQESIEAYATMQ